MVIDSRPFFLPPANEVFVLHSVQRMRSPYDCYHDALDLIVQGIPTAWPSLNIRLGKSPQLLWISDLGP